MRKAKNTQKKALPALAGIWRGRVDLKDSVTWVNNQRKKHTRKFKTLY